MLLTSEIYGSLGLLNFEQWCDEFDHQARILGVEYSYTRSVGRDNFRDHYNEGYTPKQALDEEWASI